MKLFKVNKMTHKLELVNENILTIQEFRKILEFDTNAESIFIYIYHFCDYTSPYSMYDDETRHKKAMYEAGLKDFKPDEIVKNAIKKYLELRDSSTVKTLKTAERGLLSANKVLDVTIEKFNKNLDELIKVDINKIVDEKELILYNAKFKTIKDDLSYVLKMVPEIEKNVSIVVSTLEKALKEDFNKAKAAGDKSIGNRAEPKRN